MRLFIYYKHTGILLNLTHQTVIQLNKDPSFSKVPIYLVKLVLTQGFSDYCLPFYCYFHRVSADIYFGLLQVFVELGNLRRISNYVIYWIHGFACSNSVSHCRVQVLSIPVLLLACSQDWTCNIQMIAALEA